LLVTLAAVLCLAAPPALAKSSKGRGHGKHDRDDDHHEHVQVLAYHEGGPPPWAPAHGYRRKHRHEHRHGHRHRHGRRHYHHEHREAANVYVAPFGIDGGTCNRKLLGATLGGTAGGLIASEVARGDGRTAAIVGGTLLGILIGGAVGDAMDGLDQNCVGQVLEHAPQDQTVAWRNPDNGASYDVTPVRTYQEEGGRYCREYRSTAMVGGRERETWGTACRQPDGSWQIAN
jgi:surface antigen